MSDRTCTEDGCDRPHEARGLCNTHYKLRQYRLKKTGTPLPPRQYQPICSVDGCDRKHHSKGLCEHHHRFSIKHPGEPLIPFEPRPLVRLYVAMMVTIRDRSTGCWEDWPHSSNTKSQRPVVRIPPLGQVHVARYIRFLEDGEWPIWACHHCDNELCWNPDHVYAGTRESNIADMVARGRARNGASASRTEDT